MGSEGRKNMPSLPIHHVWTVFFDVTRLQSDVGLTPLLPYTFPYKNPCVTVKDKTVRTWASGNSTLLMHALRWRPSRLVSVAKHGAIPIQYPVTSIAVLSIGALGRWGNGAKTP